MDDIITLSSDEETPTPPKKRIKLITLNTNQISRVVSDKSEKECNPCFKNIIATTNLGKSGDVTITPLKKDNVVELSDEEDPIEIDSDGTEIIGSQKSNVNNDDAPGCDDDCLIINENEVKINVDPNSSVATVQTNHTSHETNSIDDSNANEPNDLLKKENCAETSVDPNGAKIFDITHSNGKQESDGVVDENQKDNVHAFNSTNEDQSKPKTSECSSQQKPTNNFEKFLLICESNINKTKYESMLSKKIAFLRYRYKKIESEISNSSHFQKLFEESAKIAMTSVEATISSFKDVFLQIKKYSDSDSIEVTDEHLKKLKKLDKTMKLLLKKIKKLEKAEVDFDTEEDSSYLQLIRYIERLDKVNKKYCELLKRNPYSGRLTYAKLDFADSKYNEINLAISKKFKNNKMFPTFIDMKDLIKKISSENNLNLTEETIEFESRHCFKKLGELLQTRRRKELYDSHCLYMNYETDPALNDDGLKSKLDENYKDGQMKIDRVCDEYARQQSCSTTEPALSEDSDQSDFSHTEDDNENSTLITNSDASPS